MCKSLRFNRNPALQLNRRLRARGPISGLRFICKRHSALLIVALPLTTIAFSDWKTVAEADLNSSGEEHLDKQILPAGRGPQWRLGGKLPS